MSIVIKNNASNFLADGINDSQTTIDLQSAASFPSLSAGEYFYGTIENTAGQVEIVKVTNVAGNTLTVVRAQESTSAASFAEGSRFELRVTVGSVEGGAYTPAGANAVERTLQKKLQEGVSVKDFGAVGDGVTDDTSAFTAAFATGETIYVPEGVYVLTDTVTANSSFYGDGYSKSRIVGDVGSPNQHFAISGNDIVVSGINFSGDKTRHTSGGRATGTPVSGTNITIENCSFDTFTTHAIDITGKYSGTDTWVIGNNPNSEASVSNLLSRASENIVIKNCYFDTNGSNNVKAFGVNGLVVDGCTFTSRSTLQSILIDDASENFPLEKYDANDRVVITNNIFGDKLVAVFGCARAVVSNNVGDHQIVYSSYDFNQQVQALAEPLFWLNYMPARGIQVTGNVCSQIIVRSGAYAAVVGNTIIRTSDSYFIGLGDNSRAGWGSYTGQTVYDSVTETSPSSSPHFVSNNLFIAKANVTTAILNLVANGGKTNVFARENVVQEEGGTVTNVIDPTVTNNWNWSYYQGGKLFASERRGFRLLSTDDANICEMRQFGAGSNIGEFRIQTAVGSRARFQQSDKTTANTCITNNYDTVSDNVDSGTYYATGIFFRGNQGDIRFATNTLAGTAPTNKVALERTGNWIPVDDDSYNLGGASNKWGVVYAASGSINTSDANQKQQIRTLSDVERQVAQELKGLIKVFKFNNAVDRKGEDARLHFGVIAQEVKAAFEAHNLDPSRYGLFCYDEWEAEYEPVYGIRKTVDEHGQTIQESYDTGEKILVKEAGSSYGVRYEELLAFIISTL